ncbi:MAG: electron transport complex subunit RsxA [Faecousia sp.]
MSDTLIRIFTITLNAILVENFILVKFLGICPFMGVSKKMDTALGMGLAVTFVMGLASAVTWAVNHFVLVPYDMGFMQTVVFILVIAALVQLVEMFLQKSVPALYQALGIYLPLITTNCAVLGVALLNIQNGYTFLESVVYGVTGGLGFLVAIVLFASVRERTEYSDCPACFRGFPIALISAGLIALTFMGFSGLKIFS